jgi:isopenicillin N synthase-like dioxygenase
MKRTSEVWREFFNLPEEVKQEYANTPATYEGYGSRLGVEKGAILDWSDYFFLNYMPVSLRNQNKWPATPASCRYACTFITSRMLLVFLRIFGYFSLVCYIYEFSSI